MMRPSMRRIKIPSRTMANHFDFTGYQSLESKEIAAVTACHIF
jgi:hypothetical protein